MKVLFISRWFPYPANNGSKIRIYNLLRELGKEHRITLLSFFEPDEASPEGKERLSAFCRRVRVVPRIRFDPRRARALGGYISRIPRSLVDTYSADMAELIDSEIAEDRYDVIVSSEFDMVPYAFKANGMPRLLEELELAVLKEKYTSQADPARRLRYGLSWWKAARYIRRVLNCFDACTVVSETERQLLVQAATRLPPVAVIPNGVDLGFYAGDFGPVETGALVYNGSLTYSANFDAMVFFLAEIWPLIRTRRPDVRLYITGSTQGVSLTDLPQAEDVIFTGYLDDVRPRVAQSQAAVVPLRVGGGSRLKILEALALGTPVVSTSKGAEGLDVTPDDNILIGDDPDTFADAVCRVLSKRELRSRLAASGRRLVTEHYGWERIGQRLERFLYRIVQEYRRKGPT